MLIVLNIRGGVLEDVLGLEDVLRINFEVLGLGLEGQVLSLDLEASSPPKLPCPRLEDSTIFYTVEILLENVRNIAEILRRPFLFSTIGNRLKVYYYYYYY